MIGVLTIAEDLHGLAVQHAIRQAGFECHIFECDRIAQKPCLSYGINYQIPARALTSEGDSILIADLRVLWLRTTGAAQILDAPIDDSDARVLISNDCRGALAGLFATQFQGVWVSTPEATIRAADKIGQLAAAHQCGFRVPQTLVTQSRADVLEFAERCDGRIIVKTVTGAPGRFLQTAALPDPASLDEPSYAAAPAIFQELIPGCDHLRVQCFGKQCLAAHIQSDDLDWRVNLNVPVSPYEVSPLLHQRLLAVLNLLGLEMGVVDLKLTPAGEPVWLEVNPQGQFLFLDALTDLDLTNNLAAYLIAQSQNNQWKGGRIPGRKRK